MGRAVFNGFRKLLCSSKLYITAVILFSCIYTGFGGINGYLMRQGQTVQAGELFVFGMDSWIPQLIITVAFLILVNDIPFGKSGAQLQLIRSSRSRWLLGWPDDAARLAFRAETRKLFRNAGWQVEEMPLDSGHCDTVRNGKDALYLHPTVFSGVMQEDHITALQRLLDEANTFRTLETRL